MLQPEGSERSTVRFGSVPGNLSRKGKKRGQTSALREENGAAHHAFGEYMVDSVEACETGALTIKRTLVRSEVNNSL